MCKIHTGFRRGSVTVNIEEMTMHDSASTDTKRRLVRRYTTTGMHVWRAA
jgi:hypothetical protein